MDPLSGYPTECACRFENLSHLFTGSPQSPANPSLFTVYVMVLDFQNAVELGSASLWPVQIRLVHLEVCTEGPPCVFMACSSSLFSTENIPLSGRAAVYSRTSLTTKGHLGCSPRLAVTNKAIMNICVRVFVRTYVFSSSG